MPRCVPRIAAAVLLGAVLSPPWALAAPAAERNGPANVLAFAQPGWDPLGWLWSWLSGGRPDAGCSSDPNGGQCANGASRLPRPGARRPFAAGRSGAATDSGSRMRTGERATRLRPANGCSSDPNGCQTL
jgi:hypothetical protein